MRIRVLNKHLTTLDRNSLILGLLSSTPINANQWLTQSSRLPT